MPELPEVESTVRRLRPNVEGQKISNIDILWKRSIAIPTPKKFKESLQGKKIKTLTRREET